MLRTPIRLRMALQARFVAKCSQVPALRGARYCETSDAAFRPLDVDQHPRSRSTSDVHHLGIGYIKVVAGQRSNHWPEYTSDRARIAEPAPHHGRHSVDGLTPGQCCREEKVGYGKD